MKYNDHLDVIFVTSSENLGVAKNFQSGLEYCSGEWVKTIAADDILLPDCLMSLFEIKERLLPYDLVYSKSRYFNDNGYMFTLPAYRHIFFNNQQHLLDYIYFDNFINVPTLFYRRSKLVNIGGFETNYRNMEDYPTILSMVRCNSFILFIDKETVLYRVSNNSLSNFNNGGNRVNKHFVDSYYNFYKIELKKYHKSRRNIFFYFLNDFKFFLLKKHLTTNEYFLKTFYYKISAIVTKISNLYLFVFLGKQNIFKN